MVERVCLARENYGLVVMEKEKVVIDVIFGRGFFVGKWSETG